MIAMRNVEKFFESGVGKTFVLRRVNIDIKPGEFVSIMGPSGAGKSTLLHIVGMHDSAWTGEFDFLEQPVHKLGKKERAELEEVAAHEPVCHALPLTLEHALPLKGSVQVTKDTMAASHILQDAGEKALGAANEYQRPERRWPGLCRDRPVARHHQGDPRGRRRML